MAKVNYAISVVDEAIMNKIYVVRGQKVMIDRDLAEYIRRRNKTFIGTSK